MAGQWAANPSREKNLPRRVMLFLLLALLGLLITPAYSQEEPAAAAVPGGLEEAEDDLEDEEAPGSIMSSPDLSFNSVFPRYPNAGSVTNIFLNSLFRTPPR